LKPPTRVGSFRSKRCRSLAKFERKDAGKKTLLGAARREKHNPNTGDRFR